MPPKEKLPPAVIADLTEWVRRGAPWPGGDAANKARPAKPSAMEPTPTDEQRGFWAFQLPRQPQLPSAPEASWCATPIDAFVAARLRAESLAPSPSADRRAILRRANLALVGLPPTEEETTEFLRDESPDSLARLVDRLLASPRYGERWGRHWLDIARYGDSNGLDENLSFANAFRYRDYVIDAFNHDKPYDEFVREQLAGDLLPETDGAPDPATSHRLNERLTATGFLVVGAKMLAEDDPVKMQMDIVDEQVDTIGKALLGLTIGCARCHDHKYDPISMADYYGLAGIFKSTKTMENFSVVARWQERPIASPAELARRQEHQQRIDRAQVELNRQLAAQTERLTAEVRDDSARYLLAAARQLQRDELLKGAKSFGQAKQVDPAAAPAGLIVVEAENYVRGNALRTNTGYGEGIGVILNAGPLPNFAEYDVEVPAAGLYQLELRYAAADARPVSLAINGRVVKADAANRATGSWNPDTQTWAVEGFFSLRAGANVVRLERAQPFPHLDKVLLAPAPDSARQLALEPPVPASGAPSAKPLHEAYVAQWAMLLKQSREQPDSPLAEWHAYARRFAGEATVSIPPPRYVIGEPPASLAVVAQRYQTAILEADSAWRTLKASDGGRDAKTLPDARLESLRATVSGPQGPLTVPKNAEDYFSADLRESLAKSRIELKSLRESLPKFSEVMAVSDGQVADLRIHLRGNHTSLGAEVARRVPRIFTSLPAPSFSPGASGRREFVDWLVDPRHPLVSRVYVNRLWHWHFGAGIVSSTDNFGLLGQRPANPELLDWLATRLVADGWSTKRLQRELVLSAVYRQASRHREDAFLKDPENRLMWKYPRRRLEAEAIRDSILAVGGQIDFRMGGTLLTTPNRQYVTSTANVNPVVYETTRRSVYLPVVRSALYDVFQAFDFAEPSVLNGQRDSTTVPPQALFMLNSALVARQSESLARSLFALEGLDASPAHDETRLRHAYLRTLSRLPTAAERERAGAFLNDYEAAATAASVVGAAENSGLAPRQRAWQAICRALLASNEFVYVE